MKRLLVIDACIRGEDSRTLALAKPIIQMLEPHFRIERLNLNELKLTPVDTVKFKERSKGNWGDAEVLAKQFATADAVMIIAPFWDMSIPSLLKVYLEHISISGITFCDTPQGTVGNCKADKILYVTTRGMEIPTGDYREQGSSYLKAIGWLWGISEILTVAAWGMDVVSEQVRQERLHKALQDGIILCGELTNDKEC